MHKDWEKMKSVLRKGGVGVLPTDTLYGIVAQALDKKAVERIYKIKGRDENKPFIVLITSLKDLEKFGVKVTKEMKGTLETFWPGKVSVILPVKSKKFAYLHRGTNSIAFRMVAPKVQNLFKIIKSVGPLVAPSANPQGMIPAHSRKSARAYFGEGVDAYVCSGNRFNVPPSTIVEFQNGKINILRQGAAKIKLYKL